MQGLKWHGVRRPGSTWVRTRGTLLAALLGFTGCDFPTSAPILEPRFVIPGTSTTMTVAEVLPGSVTFVGTAFAVAIEGSATTRTLGQMCGAPCVAANGFVVPKPPFTVTLSSQAALPQDVLSADVRGGAVTMRIANNLNFDPLRPSASAQGSAVIQVRHGNEVIATRTFTGPLPPGSAVDLAIPVTASEVTGPLTLALTISSPVGDPVRVDTAGSMTISTSPVTRIELTEAVVRVVNRTVGSAQTSLDLTDIDATTRDHVVEGALLVRVDNPFTATGVLDLRVDPEGGSEISKTLTLVPPGPSTQRLPFTGEEMRQILGHVVSISVRGVVNQASEAGVTVRPGDVLRIRADLDLTLSTDAN